MNHGQSNSSMATTRMETTYGLTYSVARAIDVTTWQSFDVVCLCCLTHGACVKVTVLQRTMEVTTSARKRWLECCHLSMPSLRPATCAGPACVQHACILQPEA